MATKQNIIIDQGSNFLKTLSVFQSDGKTALDITTYTFKAFIKKFYTSGSSIPFIVALNDGPTGKLDISLNPITSTNMEPGRYVYDVEVISSSGAVTRVYEGFVTITPSVS